MNRDASAGASGLAGGQLKSPWTGRAPRCRHTAHTHTQHTHTRSPRSHRSCAGKWAARASIARLDAFEARRTERVERRESRAREPFARSVARAVTRASFSAPNGADQPAAPSTRSPRRDLADVP